MRAPGSIPVREKYTHRKSPRLGKPRPKWKEVLSKQPLQLLRIKWREIKQGHTGTPFQIFM